jgi:hypothetical protein
MDLCIQLRQPDFDGEVRGYTYSRNRAFLRFLLDSEGPMNDEPFQDHLHPFITLGYCTFANECRELLNDPRATRIDYLVIRSGSQ